MEFSNFDAMVIELTVAGIFAGILSFILYNKEKNRQEIDGLENKIRDLEHVIEIKQLEIQSSRLENLIQKQHELIESLQSVVHRQGAFIENQEQIEFHRKISILQSIIINLNEAKIALNYIKNTEVTKYDNFNEYALEFKIFSEEHVNKLPKCRELIREALFSNSWWIGDSLAKEIDYSSKLLKDYFDGWGYVVENPDPKTFDDITSVEKQLEWIEYVFPKIEELQKRLQKDNSSLQNFSKSI